MFFTLIEMLHDLVSRPRTRSWHDYDQHYFYDDFDDATGQRLYRWRVNDLLTRHSIIYRLAESGEDEDLLVRAVEDARTELTENALTHAGSDGDKARHAVSLFRSRSADVEAKRSACVALAGLLENRRKLIKDTFLSKDEGALFQIANQFDIRHHNADQHSHYDEAYLDWVYWWYLASVELPERLLARQDTQGA